MGHNEFFKLCFYSGVGHFLGWSERLELQEQFAEVREEKMESLAENLVSCMTGEEGKGGKYKLSLSMD